MVQLKAGPVGKVVHFVLRNGDFEEISMTFHRNFREFYGWGKKNSGKHTKNYGKSPCLMGKSTISMVMFNSYVNVYQGVSLNGNVLDELLELLSVSEVPSRITLVLKVPSFFAPSAELGLAG